ncbi:MAG TPA: FliM/FliN family flagellar motor switch protein [Pyrinomonadaceae bacterium]|nr:FliM/FliN family flagellar motor switch protein [Pyrinomonadaceae bacterium]
MKPSNKLVEIDEPMNSAGEIPLDPFAVDFFGVKKPVQAEEIAIVETDSITVEQPELSKRSDWFKTLPRFSNREAEFSTLLQNLPEDFTDEAAKIIGDSIARYTFRQTENVKCSVISVDEVNLNNAIEQTAKSPQVFIDLACQPENTSAVIALNTSFVSTIIDLILGGQGADSANSRSLSPIEFTIVEFLSLNILSEINAWLGQSVLCLQSVETEQNQPFSAHERGAEIVIDLELDNFSGIISVFAPKNFLNSLDRLQNALLKKKIISRKLSDYERIARKLDLRLQIGSTALDADSLLFLEPHDIILVEQPLINWHSGNFGDNLQICVGSGNNFRLSGMLQTAVEKGFNDELIFKIGDIISEESRRKFTPAKFKMDETTNELTAPETQEKVSEENAQTEEISASLENIQVALRVEIAGNKLSLRELQSLRAGQIIALGCRPTDPVRLVTDNNDEPVATGELIEIEGQLGVRLTKVFV